MNSLPKIRKILGLVFKTIVCLLLIGMALWFLRHTPLQAFLRRALDLIASWGPWGLAAFICLYILACLFLIPGSLLTLGAGAVFGLSKGFLAVSLGATLGATAAFLLGRSLVRNWVIKKMSSFPAFKAIDEAVGREGWKIVGLTRLSPVFPFNLLNYAFGVTRVSLRDYILSSWIGMFPGTLMYVYIGSLAGSLASLGTGEHKTTPAEWGLQLLGLGATIGVTLYVTHIARQALKKKINPA